MIDLEVDCVFPFTSFLFIQIVSLLVPFSQKYFEGHQVIFFNSDLSCDRTPHYINVYINVRTVDMSPVGLCMSVCVPQPGVSVLRCVISTRDYN